MPMFSNHQIIFQKSMSAKRFEKELRKQEKKEKKLAEKKAKEQAKVQDGYGFAIDTGLGKSRHVLEYKHTTNGVDMSNQLISKTDSVSTASSIAPARRKVGDSRKTKASEKYHSMTRGTVPKFESPFESTSAKFDISAPPTSAKFDISAFEPNREQSQIDSEKSRKTHALWSMSREDVEKSRKLHTFHTVKAAPTKAVVSQQFNRAILAERLTKACKEEKKKMLKRGNTV